MTNMIWVQNVTKRQRKTTSKNFHPICAVCIVISNDSGEGLRVGLHNLTLSSSIAGTSLSFLKWPADRPAEPIEIHSASREGPEKNTRQK